RQETQTADADGSCGPARRANDGHQLVAHRRHRRRRYPAVPAAAEAAAMMDRAVDLYRQFHHKEPHPPHELPNNLRLPVRFGDVGRAVLIVYRSAKWVSDGRQRNYIHTFESNVRFCEPWRRGLRVIDTQHWPRELVALGEFVDGVVEHAGSYMRPIVL